MMTARARMMMLAMLASALGTPSALAQSLFEAQSPPAAEGPAERPPENAEGAGPGAGAPAAPAVAARPGAPVAGPTLDRVSLLAVKPPKPREYAENDLITVIVSERNQFDRNQKMDAKKDYSNDISVDDFLDLVNLLELRSEQTTAPRLPKIALEARQDFKGDAKYKREDKATARVTARVVEVKPNGTVLLEARSAFKTDEEEQVITLSGLCRIADITDKNTIQSNQLFDMNLNVQNKGEMYRANKKGLIPRIIETIFNF